MDDQRFDQLARVLGGAQSRRRALKSVAGLGIAAVSSHFAGGAGHATVIPCDLTCPVGVAAGNDFNQCGAVVTFPLPTSVGTCGAVTCSPPSGSFFPVGTTPVTCSGTGDACGFDLTVYDTQAPVATCPADIEVIGESGTVISWPDPTFTDNCPGGFFSCAPPSGGGFSPGVTSVTCEIYDGAQNRHICSFNVNLIVPTSTATPEPTETTEPTLEPTSEPTTDNPTTEPTTENPTATEALPSAIAGTETPESVGTVTQLPNTGNTPSSGGSALLPAALVGGAAALAARFGLRVAQTNRIDAPESE